MFQTRRYVTSALLLFEWVNLLRVYLRVHFGTTVTFITSIAMAYEVHLLCAILKILMQVSMMLMMVCPKSGFLNSSAHLISNLDSTVITLADWCACSVLLLYLTG
jgi:hypothetical protein